MPIVGSKLVVREAGWSSNSNREDNPENRSAYASGPFDLKRPEQSLELGQREVPQLARSSSSGFSCYSRGPDDQGLSCGPGVIIVRERPAGGG
jgi:hypothetical protein